MKRILVTGAAGFIGSHLVERLTKRGDKVVGIDNFDPYYDVSIKRSNLSRVLKLDNFSFREADICERDSLWGAFEEAKPDVAVHLAAMTGVRTSLEQPMRYHDVNVKGTQQILDACREFSPGHLVAASSSSVYSGCTETPFREDNPVMNPISPYAATKRMNELMAHVYHHVYGMKITMLRFFTVYGPRQRPDMAIHKFTRLIDAGKPVPMFGVGDTLRDYTFVDDILDGVVASIDRPLDFELINLGAGRTMNLKRLIEIIGEAMGKEVIIDQQPMQPGDALVTQADVSKARELLGYNPNFDVEEGVRRFVAWYTSGEQGDVTAQAS